MNKRVPSKPRNLKSTVTALMGYFKDYRKQMFVIVLMVIVSSVLTVYSQYLIKPIINDGILPLVGTQPTLNTLSPLVKLVLLAIALHLTSTVIMYVQSRMLVKITHEVLNHIRRDLFSAMEKLSIGFFDTHSHGEIMSHYTNDIDTLRQMLSVSFPHVISIGFSVTGTFIMMVWLSRPLTLITILLLFVMYGVIKLIGSRSSRGFVEQQATIGQLNGYIEEMLSGQKVIKVFGHEEHVKATFDDYNEKLRAASTYALSNANILMPIMGNLSHFQYATTAMFGAILILKGHLDIGSIAAYLQYTRQFSQPISMVSQEVNVVLSALAGAERIFELMGQEPETDEGIIDLCHVIETDDGLIETDVFTGLWAWKVPGKDVAHFYYKKVAGDVRFSNVCFQYEKDKPVFTNVQLRAKPGQKVALVGHTGAGKTTVANLLTRFYDIDLGQIAYDGFDIRSIKKSALRRSLGTVLQDTRLFEGTIMENIRYGRLDAEDSEVVHAAKLANADDFINRLPQGYQTLLETDGTNLSQGQRQLLSIARAAIANPPVLILDEATSSIDTMTERHIQEGMDRLMTGRTVFVIAHRLSTIYNADQILVIDKGQVVEKGNHDSLMAEKGFYYQLYTGRTMLS